MNFFSDYHIALALLAAIAAVIEIVVVAKHCSRSVRDDIICLVGVIVLTVGLGLLVGTAGAVIAAMLGSVAGIWLAIAYGVLRQAAHETAMEDFHQRFTGEAPAGFALDAPVILLVVEQPPAAPIYYRDRPDANGMWLRRPFEDLGDLCLMSMGNYCASVHPTDPNGTVH